MKGAIHETVFDIAANVRARKPELMRKTLLIFIDDCAAPDSRSFNVARFRRYGSYYEGWAQINLGLALRPALVADLDYSFVNGPLMRNPPVVLVVFKKG